MVLANGRFYQRFERPADRLISASRGGPEGVGSPVKIDAAVAAGPRAGSTSFKRRLCAD